AGKIDFKGEVTSCLSVPPAGTRFRTPMRRFVPAAAYNCLRLERPYRPPQPLHSPAPLPSQRPADLPLLAYSAGFCFSFSLPRSLRSSSGIFPGPTFAAAEGAKPAREWRWLGLSWGMSGLRSYRLFLLWPQLPSPICCERRWLQMKLWPSPHSEL